MSENKQEQYKTAMGRYDYLAPNEITVCIPKAEYEELLTFKVRAETSESYKDLIFDMDSQIKSLKKDIEDMTNIEEIELPEEVWNEQ